jgi:GT2 family glycosyltransferase
MVAVTVVTYNSARYIRQCLESIFGQDQKPAEVVVIDNASSDTTRAILRDYEDRIHIVYNSSNIGFAAAQNQAIRLTTAHWILVLNPDVQLIPSFLRELVAAAELDSALGTLCGKLLAMNEDGQVASPPLFDSTGIYFTPNLRHFDRGSRMPDEGQYDRMEYVFGATGAAALYRRAMIDDISIGGEFFDADFFAYREDADVAWRAQLLGWKCLYVPAAVAYHVRSVLPSNRRSVSRVINMHSVKNRFLMRIKNMTRGLYRRYWFSITLRDLLVVGACLTYEIGSLPGLVFVIRNFRRTWAKRREIMRRRRVTGQYIAGWFSDQPASLPASSPLVQPARGSSVNPR